MKRYGFDMYKIAPLREALFFCNGWEKKVFPALAAPPPLLAEGLDVGLDVVPHRTVHIRV